MIKEKSNADSVPGSRILIVSSSPDDTFSYREGARLAGYDSITVGSLGEVAPLLDSVQPLAIVLDKIVAGENSMTALAGWQERADMESIAIIVVLECREPHDIFTAYDNGADAAIQRPVQPVDLQSVLQSVFED